MKANDPPIIIEATYNRSVADVWKAITQLDQMHQWYFDNIPAFKPEVGFEVSFDVQTPNRVFPHVWKIVKAIPNKIITYHWSSGDAFEGAGLVSFELIEKDDITTLRLTNEVIEDYPDGIPEFTRESCHGGWTYFIQQSLKNYLEPTA